VKADHDLSFTDGSVYKETTPINRESPVPLHHQVRTYLLACIESGELRPGQQLLKEREYADRFGISLAPVRQAILDLVKEGYLYRVAGKGTFVRERKVEEKISILSSFTESMHAKGFKSTMRIVDLSVGPAPIEVRAAFEADNEAKFVFLQRVALMDGKAIALLQSYIPVQLVPELETLDLTDQSLYRTLEDRYGIILTRAESFIEVVRCHDPQAALLGLPSGIPMLQVESKTYDREERLIEFSRVLYQAERFRFTIESFRHDYRVLHLIGKSEKDANPHDDV
jgi:GntR family transcriptional regulator